MKQLFPPSTKNPPESSLSPAGLVESFDPVHSLLVAATAAKIKMESRQADVSAAAAVAGAMARIRNVMPVAAMPAVAAMTWRVVAARAMTGTVPASMTWCVMAAGAMPGVVSVTVAGTVTAAVTATAGMMISRLHSGRSEDGEAGGDSQESDEFFHDALVFGLSRCRQRAACQSDAAPMRLFSSSTLFSSH